MTTLEEISALTQPRHPDDWTEIDSAAVDTARVLAADAVQKVGNGHPGTAMSLAPLAYTLFQRAMRHDPSDTTWLGRDRFVLSCGHSSLTLYIQLYLGGFGLELSDIESLRTWGSKTPGHPEFRHTAGVEITTGPLGQGLASAVGMAMAARYERGLFDPDAEPGTSPFDHHIYVIASDGDIEEGVTSEASSLAAVQQLGNLIVFYDHNKISIEDDTNIALCEDTAARYRAYGWHVQEVEGGENVTGIEEAIANAKAVTDRPSFISLRTIIGYPAPNMMNTGKVHGAALGDEEVAAVKTVLGFDPNKAFEVREDVITHTRGMVARGKEAHESWQADFEAWAQREPQRKALLDRLTAQQLPDGWDATCRAGSPVPKHWPRGQRPDRCWPRSAPNSPSCGAVRLTLPAATTPPSRARTHSARQRSLSMTTPRTGTAARCTSVFASTRWAPSSPGSRCTDPPAPTVARSCSSPITCARQCGWRH